MRTAAKWKEIASRGTSGDMVWDVIGDLEKLESKLVQLVAVADTYAGLVARQGRVIDAVKQAVQGE